MKKKLFVSICIFCCLLLSAQNLIRNSSFENNYQMPRREGNSINRAIGWMAPKYSSDYYFKGGGFFHAGVPHNTFGHQHPHSGKAYAGICTRTHFLEYIETVLRDTLRAGQTYQIELYISRAELSFRSIKEFGVLFTNKKIWGVQSRGISAEPQVKFTHKHGFRNKHKWTKLTAIYTAEGGETIFIFGHFNYNKRDDRRRLNAHYYVDDVSVFAIQKEPEEVMDSVLTITQTTIQQELPETKNRPEFGKRMVLEQVLFENNKANLLQASFKELNGLIDFLKENEQAQLQIAGHTDAVGNEQSNQVLSELRAEAVATYLSEHGIDATRIQYSGYGSRKPIAENETEEGRRKNRRVEIIISMP